jgi:hypothetical protein
MPKSNLAEILPKARDGVDNSVPKTIQVHLELAIDNSNHWFNKRLSIIKGQTQQLQNLILINTTHDFNEQVFDSQVESIENINIKHIRNKCLYFLEGTSLKIKNLIQNLSSLIEEYPQEKAYVIIISSQTSLKILQSKIDTFKDIFINTLGPKLKTLEVLQSNFIFNNEFYSHLELDKMEEEMVENFPFANEMKLNSTTNKKKLAEIAKNEYNDISTQINEYFTQFEESLPEFEKIMKFYKKPEKHTRKSEA